MNGKEAAEILYGDRKKKKRKKRFKRKVKDSKLRPDMVWGNRKTKSKEQ